MSKALKILRFIIGIIFLFILPVFFSYQLFFNKNNTKIPLSNTSIDDGAGVKVTIEEFPKGLANDIRRAFQVPFDLNTYSICLQNRNKIEGALGERYLKSKLVLYSEDNLYKSKPIEIKGNDIVCGEIDLNTFIIKNLSVELPEIKDDYLPAKFTFNGDILANEDLGAQPTMSVRYISTFIFLLAYGSAMKLIMDWLSWFWSLLVAIYKAFKRYRNNRNNPC